MDAVTSYFSQEKKESAFFSTVGFLACLLSIFYLVIWKDPFFNGISYAFISIGMVQIVVGASVFFKSDIDTVRVNFYIERDRKNIDDYEIPRMELVIKNFIIYRRVESVLIVVGLILLWSFPQKSITCGLGLGLTIQSSVMLLWDYLAEKRGINYLKYLKSLT